MASKIEYDFSVVDDHLDCGTATPAEDLERMRTNDLAKYSGVIAFITSSKSDNGLRSARDTIGNEVFQVCEENLVGEDPFRRMLSKLYCPTAVKGMTAYSHLDTTTA